MRFKRGAGVVWIFCSVFFFFLTGIVYAQSATVTIGVGDTILSVSGKTSPNAFVTISKDSSVIGTVVANSGGEYSQTFPAQDPGLHELQLFAHTTSGANTDAVLINVNIAEHATTSVDVFLPSTILVEDTTLEHGQQLILSGETAPSSTVVIYIDSNVYASTNTDAQGLWSASLQTTLLTPGQHEFFVRVTDGIGNQSYPTSARFFSLATQPGKPGESSSPPLPQPSRDIPHVPFITFPQSGTVWRQPTIDVAGTADSNVQVELWDGMHIIGSVWSDVFGKWSIPLMLQAKEYALRARACIDRRCSAFSSIIRFTYQAEGVISPRDLPLLIRVPQSHFTVYQYQSVSLLAFVLNGQPPYTTTVDWGDGVSQKNVFIHDSLSFSHTYTKPGYYTVAVDVQDAQGRKNRIYFTVEAKPSTATVFPGFLLFILLLIAILCLLLGRKRHKTRVERP